VDLMHVLHRPHLPPLVSVGIAAAILALVISLALVSSLSNISQPNHNTGTPLRSTAPTLTSARQTNVPRWDSNPFAGLLGRPLPRPWQSARR
jgi:hypothetical protein